MGFWTQLVHAPRIVVDYASDEFAKGLPWALAALGIGLGGVIVAWVLIKIAEWLTKSNSLERDILDKKTGKHYKASHRSQNNWIRLFFMSFAILALTFGFWIAAHTAGFNFWTVFLGYGIMSLVATYAFGTVLQNAGAFFLIAMTGKIEEEWWVEVMGLGAEGIIKAIHISWVELIYTHPETKERIQVDVPTSHFLTSVVKRYFSKEIRHYNDSTNTALTTSGASRVQLQHHHRLKSPEEMV